VAGLSRDEFEAVGKEILAAWERAQTRDEGLRVIVDFGRKHGFKNVMAVIQGRTPKRFDREVPVERWVAGRNEQGE